MSEKSEDYKSKSSAKTLQESENDTSTNLTDK